MDTAKPVHISIEEGQSPPRNDMDADLHDNARSSFISSSSGTSGTSDESNYRDSVISYTSVESMDRQSLAAEGGGLSRINSTRSMPPERTYNDSDGSEDGHMLMKDVVRKTLSRKTAIRRTHTLTPNSSPKVKDRRNRSISSSESPLAELQKRGVVKENVTFYFELRYYTQTHEVKATKDLQLREAIKPILLAADIDLRSIDIFIESSTSPTPLDFLVFPLSGRQLHVRAKAGRNSQSVINPSFAPRKMKDGEENEEPGELCGVHTMPMRKDMSKFLGVEQKVLQPTPRPPSQTLERKKDLTKLLGINQPDPTPKGNRRTSVAAQPVIKDPAKEKVDPKFLKLQQTLDNFMINGLPDFPGLLTFSAKREDDEDSFQFEESWRLMGDEESIGKLTKKQTDQQEAIWEIIKTEVDYIKNIRIMVDFYLRTLINLQASVMLNEIETEKIFSNIAAIEKLHTRFWKERLSNVIKKAQAEKRIPCALDLAEAFEGFADLFAPYIKFCTDEPECMKYLRERTKENEMLKFFIEWAERHQNSRRRKLQDLLVYPMQRITKYHLLLIAVEKKTLEEDEHAVISTRISEVREFVMRVNHELRQEQERQTMEDTIDHIEAYEGVSLPSGCEELTKLVEDHLTLHLLGSMPNAPPAQARWLHMKGALKIRDADNRQLDAFGFLFTDMFVLTKPKKGDNYRIIKPPMRVDMIKTQELKDGGGFALVHVDEYDCAVYGCVLSASNASDWLHKMETARELYENLCSLELDYHNRKDADDGSGEPPTSPEDMVFSMQNTAFPPLNNNSPYPSPLNSPKFNNRRLLPPLNTNLRTGSQSSLNTTGGVSPVPEENTEEGEGMNEDASRETGRVSSPGASEVGTDGGSVDNPNSLNSQSRNTFPPSKRQSLNEQNLNPAVAPGETNGESPTKTPTQGSLRRPANLMLPPAHIHPLSPVSPNKDIMSFESDDDEPEPTICVHAPTSPRKVSLQQPSVYPVKKSPNKVRRKTVAAGAAEIRKQNGEEGKSKGKFSKLRNKMKSTPSKI